jgi:hypothetical protein
VCPTTTGDGKFLRSSTCTESIPPLSFTLISGCFANVTDPALTSANSRTAACAVSAGGCVLDAPCPLAIELTTSRSAAERITGFTGGHRRQLPCPS